MDGFLSFLKSSKVLLNNLSAKSKRLHITLGNESCDLDSMISSLLLGYHISKREPENLTMSVLNVSRENFFLRTENCFVLKEANVNIDDLIFRDEVNFADIIKKYTVTVSLVDHHILSKSDEILSKYVVQIFDHRPVDTSYYWDSKIVEMRIEQVGSCCTLIADELLKKNCCALTKPLAYLLYQAIIYDTIALKPENLKVTPLDLEISSKLNKVYEFSEDPEVLYSKLWAAHNDVSHLKPKQLLYKDLKIVEGVYIPGLPMLVEEYLKLTGAYQAVVEFADEHKIDSILLVGLNTSGSVKRDLAIYSKDKEDKLRAALLYIFKSNEEYDFQFEERPTQFQDIELLHIHNIKLSRKQLVPLVKKAWNYFVRE